MNFAEWEPVYKQILADFGFPRAADERARDVLASLLSGSDTYAYEEFDVRGKTVAIAGAGPNLEAEAVTAADTDRVFAASSAAGRLTDVGVAVDCVVTDLDGDPGRLGGFVDDGTPVAVHAHGDNVPALREYVPALDSSLVLPTTQAVPVGPVQNPGGFTDGDRTAFLADHLGADRLVFVGWDFDDAAVDAVKRRKLAWAERLLAWLEARRGERFDLLDGRRGAVDPL